MLCYLSNLGVEFTLFFVFARIWLVFNVGT